MNCCTFLNSLLIASHRLLCDLLRSYSEAEPVLFPRSHILHSSLSPHHVVPCYFCFPPEGISNSKLFMWLWSNFSSLLSLGQHYSQCWKCDTSNAPRGCVHAYTLLFWDCACMGWDRSWLQPWEWRCNWDSQRILSYGNGGVTMEI